jgi:uncharacterized protein YjbJ (UPF0337 family)
MSAEDKAKNAGQKATGKVKEGPGKAADGKSLEAEGHADQAKGDLKDAGERSKTPSKSNAPIQVASLTMERPPGNAHVGMERSGTVHRRIKCRPGRGGKHGRSAPSAQPGTERRR